MLHLKIGLNYNYPLKRAPYKGCETTMAAI